MKSIFTKFKISSKTYLLLSALTIALVIFPLVYFLVLTPPDKHDVVLDSPKVDETNKAADIVDAPQSQNNSAPATPQVVKADSSPTKNSSKNNTKSTANTQAKVTPSMSDLNFQTIDVYDPDEYGAKRFSLPYSYQGWKKVSLAYHAGINDSYPDDSFPDQYKALEIAGLEQNFTLPASFDAIARIRAQLKDEAMKVNDVDIEVRHKIWYQNRKVETVLPILILELQKFDMLLEKYRQTINSTPPLINPL